VTASPDGGAESDTSTAVASAAGDQAPAAGPGEPPPAPAAAAAPAEDRETPTAPRVPSPRAAADAETPRASRRAAPPVARSFLPLFDVGAELGFFQGGEELVTATNSEGNEETLGTGDGLLLALTTRVTPVWLAERVGLGVGAGAGLKYWSVGGTGAEASMFKYLLTGTGHLLLSVDPTWLVFIQAGVEKNYGMDLSINSQSTGIPFRSRVGFVGEFGAQHALNDFWSFAFSLRATIIHYDVEDIPVGANSVGMAFSLRCGR